MEQFPGYLSEKRKEVQQMLIESGEMAKLEEYIRRQLLTSRWKDDLKDHCRQLIRSKGIDKVNLEELANELEKRGALTIPGNVREDLLVKVRQATQHLQDK